MRSGWIKKLYFVGLLGAYLPAGPFGPVQPLSAADIKPFKKAGLPSKFVKHIAVDGDDLWIATAKGAVRYNTKTGARKVYTKANKLRDNFIWYIAVDKTYAWIATPKGLSRLTKASGAVTNFTVAGKHLSDDEVRAVLVDDDRVWVGTRLGVNYYDKATNQWGTVDALSGLFISEISDFALTGNRIWASGKGGIASYDKGQGIWETFDEGLNSDAVTGLAVIGNSVYCSTGGGGIAKFSIDTSIFENFSSADDLVDDSVEGIAADGKYLWLMTFAGVSRMDTEQNIFKNFKKKDGLTEEATFAGAVLGDTVYIGSDGGGLFTYKKSVPMVKFRPDLTGYTEKGKIAIYADIIGKSLTGLQVEHQEAGSFTSWSSENIKVDNNFGPSKKVAEIDAKKLKNAVYSVKVSVKSGSESNYDIGTVVVDNTKPLISLKLKKPDAGQKIVKLRGTFVEDNMRTIVINLENTTKPIYPKMNFAQLDFTFDYPVNGGDITIKATDVGLNTTTLTQSYIIDNKDPVVKPDTSINYTDYAGQSEIPIKGTVIEQNLDEVIINPGNIKAKTIKVGADEWEYEASVPVKGEGLLKFVIFAIDKTGREGKATQNLKFFADQTILDVSNDKIPEYTLRDTVTFSGFILGPLLKKLAFKNVTTGQEVPANVTVKTDASGVQTKNWEAVVPLAKGKNEILLVAVHKESEEEKTAEYVVERGEGRPVAKLGNNVNYNTPTTTITGKIEPGVIQVIVERKAAKIKKDNTFESEVTLKDGPNAVTIISIDELNRKTTARETVYLDREPPEFRIRPLPPRTGLIEIPVQGSVKERAMELFSISPGGTLTRYNPGNGDFTGRVKLKEGINRIVFYARDAAGNKAIKEFTVDYKDSYPKIAFMEGSEQIALIQQLRDEIEELKKALAAKGPTGPVTFGTPKIALPNSSSLHFVPFQIGRNRSFSDLSRLYYGSPTGASFIASLNRGTSVNTIRKRKRVLVPTKNLYQMMTRSRYRRQLSPLVMISAASFASKGAGQSLTAYRGRIIKELRRRRLLSRIKVRGGDHLFNLRNGTVLVLTKGSALQAAGKLKSEMRRSRVRTGLVASFRAGNLTFSEVRI